MLVLVSAFPVSAEDHRVGAVDISRIYKESFQVQSAAVQLENEFDQRRLELMAIVGEVDFLKQQLAGGAGEVTGAARAEVEQMLQAKEAELAQGEKAWGDDLEKRRAEETRNFKRALRETLKRIGEARGFDLILVDGIGYVSLSVDLTDEVIAWINDQYRRDQNAGGK